MKLKIGHFYQRESGNIFRVTSKHNGICKCRNIRHCRNGIPYTWQSEIFESKTKNVKLLGTEQVLNVLANNYTIFL